MWLFCLCSFAGLRPVLIVSVPFRGCLCVALFPVCSRRGVVVIGLLLRDQHTLAVKVLNEQTKLPEDGLDRLKHVGVVGSILTK